MKSEALFLNGVYHSVLDEILAVQTVLPEQITVRNDRVCVRLRKARLSGWFAKPASQPTPVVRAGSRRNG
jgi:hypothetical protein